MRSGTDYVGVLDDQLRWDTTRATISCSLRYKLLYVSGLHLLAHLKLFVLGTSGLQMLYLSFSRIARRLCVCVCVYVLVHAGDMHNMLSLLSLCAAVSQKQQAENQLLHLLRVHEEEKSASILYIFFLLFFVLMRSYDRIG